MNNLLPFESVQIWFNLPCVLDYDLRLCFLFTVCMVSHLRLCDFQVQAQYREDI